MQFSDLRFGALLGMAAMSLNYLENLEGNAESLNLQRVLQRFHQISKDITHYETYCDKYATTESLSKINSLTQTLINSQDSTLISCHNFMASAIESKWSEFYNISEESYNASMEATPYQMLGLALRVGFLATAVYLACKNPNFCR